MSVERSLEAWEEVQRQGLDLADRLAQGFNGLLLQTTHHINPPPFTWSPYPLKPTTNHVDLPFTPSLKGIDLPDYTAGVSAVFDIGNRIGQAGVELGASLNGVVQQFFRHLPVPFRHEDDDNDRLFANESVSVIPADLSVGARADVLERHAYQAGNLGGKFGDGGGFFEPSSAGGVDEIDEDGIAFDARELKHFARPKGSINITSTYDSRTRDFESSLVARGDLWRAEASHGGSTSGNDSSPLYLLQLGPVLFVRDTTLLLPVHLSKQHLLWYGYDRKNGMHSFCPALWSKHRRWLLMSMICLNPLACSFLDVQFPNGQFTYVAGEGLTSSAFLPIFGGLLQLQGQYPGETRLSFSCKSKYGTRITPAFQWPDKSFSIGVAQSLAWRKSGMMLRPAFQFSVCPMFGGSNPGMKTEIVHSVKDSLSLICGCAFSAHPSAYASISLGRSKWNGYVGSSGVVVKVETPLGNIGRPSYSVQLNTGAEF